MDRRTLLTCSPIAAAGLVLPVATEISHSLPERKARLTEASKPTSVFDTVADLLTAPGLVAGQIYQVNSGALGTQEKFQIVLAGTYSAPDGVLVRNVTGASAQAVSLRTVYASVAELKADPRTAAKMGWSTSGATTLTVPSVFGGIYQPVASGGTFGANAGGQQISVVIASGLTSLDAFGCGGTNDDTKAFQNAINAASAAPGIVHIFGDPDTTYTVTGITPRSGIALRLAGAIISLKNSALAPVIFDQNTGEGGRNFYVFDATIDSNQANGNSGTNVLGGIWLTNWSNIGFKNIKIENCAGIGINLVGCRSVEIDFYTFENSGVSESGRYAYGLICNSAGYIAQGFLINNVSMSNVLGYGCHFYQIADLIANNLNFDTLQYKKTAIAITLTEVKRGRVTNVKVNATSGDSIEVNDTEDVCLENFNVNAAGNRALLIGQNKPGLINTRLKVENFVSTNTVGAFAAALTWMKDSEFRRLNLDKKATYDVSGRLSKDNEISNSVIADIAASNANIIYYGAFSLRDISFLDYRINRRQRGTYEVSVSTTIPASGEYDLPMESIAPGFLAFHGVVEGTLCLSSAFSASPSTQGSFQRVDFLVNNQGTAANLGMVSSVANAVSRTLEILGDAARKQLVLRNSTGGSIDTNATLTFRTNN